MTGGGPAGADQRRMTGGERAGCALPMHEHIAENLDDETIVLVMKAKPLFLFMHLLFQKVTKRPPGKAPPGQENYVPPTEI